MANIAKLKELRQKLPKEKFKYDAFFGNVKADTQFGNSKTVSCKTTSCCAGFCVILFKLKRTCYATFPDDLAQQFLELTDKQADFLFHKYSMIANYDDAIKRLDWLIARKNISKYLWSKESHYRRKVTRTT